MGVKEGGEVGEGEEVREGGEGEGRRVKRYPCVITEASLMSKPITKEMDDSQLYKVGGVLLATSSQSHYHTVTPSPCHRSSLAIVSG